MKVSSVLLLSLISVAWAADQPSSLIANVSGRTTTSLNGAWHIIVDPYETGLRAQYYENAKPQDARAGCPCRKRPRASDSASAITSLTIADESR